MFHKKEKSQLYLFLRVIKKIEEEISARVCFDKSKNENQWEINRLQWNKNRFIFEKFFYKKDISSFFLRLLHIDKQFDRNLMEYWKDKRFKNLCSIKVIRKRERESVENGICRIPLSERSIQSIYKIEKESGCICCSSKSTTGGPIWWDRAFRISFCLRNELERKSFLSFVGRKKKVKWITFSNIIKLNQLKIILKAGFFYGIKVDYISMIFLFILSKKIRKKFFLFYQNWNSILF
mmetsp:Transcript_45745/g.91555  ORF Transcript_45745/g.91555 Transcript_45745/m.91555 type:complete len:236 (+) Transcript_45745:2476-3183(+)